MATIKTSYPNQKYIIVNKEMCNKEHKYAKINLEALEAAMNDLHTVAAGLSLYIYFAKNQDGYESYLSSKAFTDMTGYSIKAYNTAVNALIEKGYLVNEKGNVYTFYEKPRKVKVETKEEPEEPNVICIEETETKTETKTETTTTKSKKTYSSSPPREISNGFVF